MFPYSVLTYNYVTIRSIRSTPGHRGSQGLPLLVLPLRRTVSVYLLYLFVSNEMWKHFVLGVVAPCLYDATAFIRYKTCRIALFSVILAIISLGTRLTVGVVGTEELGHLFLWVSNREQCPRIVDRRKGSPL